MLVEYAGTLTVPNQKATANYVPAAAVIRRWQALSGIIGRKARAVWVLSRSWERAAEPWRVIGNWETLEQKRKVECHV